MAPPPLQQQRSGFMGPAGQNQGSALIAQLTQPPSSPFPQHRMDGEFRGWADLKGKTDVSEENGRKLNSSKKIIALKKQ